MAKGNSSFTCFGREKQIIAKMKKQYHPDKPQILKGLNMLNPGLVDSDSIGNNKTGA